MNLFQVLDAALALFSALVARDASALVDLAGSKSYFVPVLYRLLESLDHENDPLWLISFDSSDVVLKRAGISKLEKTLVSTSVVRCGISEEQRMLMLL